MPLIRAGFIAALQRMHNAYAEIQWPLLRTSALQSCFFRHKTYYVFAVTERLSCYRRIVLAVTRETAVFLQLPCHGRLLRAFGQAHYTNIFLFQTSEACAAVPIFLFWHCDISSKYAVYLQWNPTSWRFSWPGARYKSYHHISYQKFIVRPLLREPRP